MQIKTILVPSDFSDYAEYAFTWALEMAEKWGATVVVMHAAPTFSHLAYPESVYMVDLAKMEAEILADSDKKLREFIAKKGTSTIPVETRAVLAIPSGKSARWLSKNLPT